MIVVIYILGTIIDIVAVFVFGELSAVYATSVVVIVALRDIPM